jgi:hypothetical protein
MPTANTAPAQVCLDEKADDDNAAADAYQGLT